VRTAGEIGEADSRGLAGRGAEDHNRAVASGLAQSTRQRQAAYRFQDEVERPVRVLDPWHHLRRAETPYQRLLLRVADDAGDAGAGARRQLNGEQADAAGGARHQDRAA